jgi:hypothetical protein
MPTTSRTTIARPTTRVTTTRVVAVSATATAPAQTNRLATSLDTLNFKTHATTTRQLKAMKVSPAEFPAAFRTLAAKNPTQARKLAIAFDDTLESDDALRQHFDFVARTTPKERKLVIDAYRTGGRGARVVQAVGAMPAAHGRVLMKEFLVKAGGAVDRTGAWVKTNPMPQLTGDRPSVGHEDIVIGHATGRTMAWNGAGRPCTWRGTRDKGYGAEPHPNQKPAWLMQALLGMFAPPDALVLDPYFGSGTTAIGALATERLPGEVPAETACPKCAKRLLEQYHPPLPVNARVVGVEGDPKYVELSISRIREAAPALLQAA